MKLLAVFALLLVSSCGACDSELTPYCAEGQACWPRYQGSGFTTGEGMPSTPSTGECFPGVVRCSEEGEQFCDDPILPTREQCNALDDDCDGAVDEGLPIIGPFDEDNTCDLCGLCTYAEQWCAGGQWICVPEIQPRDEQCNGLDDDCDCVADDGLDVATFSYPEEEYPNTVGRGQCAAGVTRCENGVPFETLPVTPSEEVCDGRDNDCDGLVDEATEEDPKAFMLVIDVSGSMSEEIDAVRMALCDFALAADSGTQFAVVIFGAAPPAPYVAFLQDFAGPTETCATMEEVGAVTSTGPEYALEGVLVAGGLNWPDDDDQTVLVFTDEIMQHWGDATPEFEVSDLCAEIPFELGVYTLPEFQVDWTPLTTMCGGFEEDLESDRFVFSVVLLNRFFGNCAD